MHQRDVVRGLGNRHVEIDVAIGVLERVDVTTPALHRADDLAQAFAIGVGRAHRSELGRHTLQPVAQLEDVVDGLRVTLQQVHQRVGDRGRGDVSDVEAAPAPCLQQAAAFEDQERLSQ